MKNTRWSTALAAAALLALPVAGSAQTTRPQNPPAQTQPPASTTPQPPATTSQPPRLTPPAARFRASQRTDRRGRRESAGEARVRTARSPMPGQRSCRARPQPVAALIADFNASHAVRRR